MPRVEVAEILADGVQADDAELTPFSVRNRVWSVRERFQRRETCCSQIPFSLRQNSFRDEQNSYNVGKGLFSKII